MSISFAFFLPYFSLHGCIRVPLGSQLLGLCMDSRASEKPAQGAKASAKKSCSLEIWLAVGLCRVNAMVFMKEY